MTSIFQFWCALGIFTFGVWFGRRSATKFMNKELSKRELEFNEYAKDVVFALERASTELHQKELIIRKAHQNAVVDIAKYQFMDRKDQNTWTQMDDAYLDSWSSAEPKEDE